MEDDTPEKYTCLICFGLIIIPACCSKCLKIYCKVCLEQLKKTNVATCPLRCPNWSVKNLSDEELLKYNATEITCDCCKQIVKLKHYREHKISMESAYLCFNFRRCKRLSKYQSPAFERPSFCSPSCYQFYWLTRARFSEFYDDLYEPFKANPEHFKDYYEKEVNEYPLKLKESLVFFDQDNCASDYSFPTSNKCVLSSQSRFYKTVYTKEPLKRSHFYIFKIEVEKHQNYIKMGVAKENRKLENGAFCDDDFGVAFVSNGQTRKNNVDGSLEIFKPQDLNVRGFFLQVDLVQYELVLSLIPFDVNDEDEEHRVVLKIPEDWDQCYLAFAAKHHESIFVS